jgi:CubicO group peptidase (beta-lactamase class C family)
MGTALEEGAIRSIDDPAETYVPGLAGTAYGKTPIKALLQMASGVPFREVYTDMQSDIAILAMAALGQAPGGALAVLPRFNTRQAPPGQRFSYSSAESSVLGLVLASATRKTVSDYASEKLWRPLGAEADASWSVDATGQEVTYAYFNAALRDWARLGLMLAHDGTWAGKRVVSREWLRESTTTTPASPSTIYGYHVWLHPSAGRSFSLRGLRGQVVLVDPDRQLTLVQTAAHPGIDQAADQELFALWMALRSQLGARPPAN